MVKYLYIYGDSFLHKLDPRTKIIMTLSLFVPSMLLKTQIHILVIMILLLWFLAAITKLTPVLAKVRLVFLIVSLTSIVSWTIFGSRNELLWWIIYKEPLGMGVSAALRSILAISASLVVLLGATRNEEIAAGFVKLGIPYRGAFAFSSALRMAPVLIGVVQTVIAAQKSRGLDVDSGSFLDRLRKYIPLLAPAFLLTMRQTDQFSQAIESKGYGYPVVKRSSYLDLKLKSGDYLWIFISIVIIVGSIITNAYQCCAVFTLLE